MLTWWMRNVGIVGSMLILAGVLLAAALFGMWVAEQRQTEPRGGRPVRAR